MQNNRILAVAIASTLSVSSGVAYGLNFENVKTSQGLLESSQPATAFDFTDKYVISIGDSTGYGTVYASELFGASRTLPSGEVKTSGEYAAVVYTIDGTISDDFEMTFTLDNGAIFADAPLLGIDGSASGSGDGLMANTSLDIGATSVGIKDNEPFANNDVFRFATHDTLYQVTAIVGASNSLTFQELGKTTGLTVAVTDSGTGVKLMKYTDVVTEIVAETAATGTPVAAPSNNSVANIATGFENLIVGAYYTFSGAEHNVTAKGTGICATTANCIKVEPNHAAASNFPAGTFTRAFKTGDNQFFVANGAALTDGKTYMIAGNNYTIGVSDNLVTIDPTSKSPFVANNKLYRTDAFDTSAGDQWKDGLGTLKLPIDAKSATGSGKSTATFLVEPSKGVDDLKLASGDKLMLIYKLGNTKALASSGQKINMAVSLKTPLTNIKVNPARTLTGASSRLGIKEADIKPIISGSIKISVLTDSKEFVGDYPQFIGSREAAIAYINIDNDDENTDNQKVKIADGITNFELGKTGALADKSSFKITEGQFAASIKTPGKVFIEAGSVNLQADEITETEATWKLQDTHLQSIETAGDDQTSVHIKTDGKTAVNVPENNPMATLIIDFDDTGMTDLTVETELQKIKKDGTICHIYNVPNTGAGDALSIRITNDSAMSGKLTITLYNMDGTQAIDAGTELFGGEEIKPDETRRLSAADLEALAGAAWTGRARAVISSTLPKLAILALLRQTVPGAPLTNLSVGATGNSCNSD